MEKQISLDESVFTYLDRLAHLVHAVRLLCKDEKMVIIPLPHVDVPYKTVHDVDRNNSGRLFNAMLSEIAGARLGFGVARAEHLEDPVLVVVVDLEYTGRTNHQWRFEGGMPKLPIRDHALREYVRHMMWLMSDVWRGAVAHTHRERVFRILPMHWRGCGSIPFPVGVEEPAYEGLLHTLQSVDLFENKGEPLVAFSCERLYFAARHSNKKWRKAYGHKQFTLKAFLEMIICTHVRKKGTVTIFSRRRYSERSFRQYFRLWVGYRLIKVEHTGDWSKYTIG